jgi:hypothetical protein
LHLGWSQSQVIWKVKCVLGRNSLTYAAWPGKDVVGLYSLIKSYLLFNLNKAHFQQVSWQQQRSATLNKKYAYNKGDSVVEWFSTLVVCTKGPWFKSRRWHWRKRNKSPFTFLRIVSYILSALTCLWTQIQTSVAYLAPSMEWSPII